MPYAKREIAHTMAECGLTPHGLLLAVMRLNGVRLTNTSRAIQAEKTDTSKPQSNPLAANIENEFRNKIDDLTRTNAELKKQLSAALSQKPKVALTPSFDEWYPNLEKMPPEVRWPAYKKIASDVESRLKNIPTGSFELETRPIPQLDMDGKPRLNDEKKVVTKQVYRVKTSPTGLLAPNRSFSIIGMFVSDVKSMGDVPTFTLASGTQVEKKTLGLKYHDAPNLLDSLEKGFYYVELDEFRHSVNREKKLIVEIMDLKSPTTGYLLWLTKVN
jgi:hypothetical protein